MNTVNVIYFENIHELHLEALHAFPDDTAGNRQAEEKFVEYMKQINPRLAETDKRGTNARTIENSIEDGYYQVSPAVVLLVHSN